MGITIRAAAPLNFDALLPMAQVNQQLRRDAGDDDALVQGYRATALSWVERYTRQSLVARQWTATLDGFQPSIRLPIEPIKSVDAISYLTPAGAGANGLGLLRLAGGLLVVASGQSWPAMLAGLATVTITVTAGFDDVASEAPQLLTAALMMIGHLYDGGSAQDVPDPITMLCDDFRTPVLAG